VRHVEQFISSFKGRRLGELSRAEVVGYLDGLARDPKAPAWRIRQQVDAIRLLLVELVRVEAGRDVDWDFYGEAGLQALEEDHPTLARELPPEWVVRRAKGQLAEGGKAEAVLMRMVRTLRTQNYAIRTESAYRDWILRFFRFTGEKDPDTLGLEEVNAFLSYLAIERGVSRGTQRQALNSIGFLFKHVLHKELALEEGFRAAKPRRRLPVVLSREEVRRLLEGLEGRNRLMAGLLYGAGMRLMELVRLRVQDVDFSRTLITVRNAKGRKDRVVPLPEGLSLFDAMAIGTAGFTAALALHRLELNGQRPDKGPLLITGASGGVGSLAVDIFSGQGYAVTAMTGKADQYDTLRRLGASEIIGREDLPMGERPLEKGIWGGAVDNVGGATLAAITRTVRPWGSIAAIGMAGGIKLHTTVMPFIIRGVSLLGINSAGCPGSLRGELWQRLATDLRPLHLEVIVDQTVTLDDLPWVFDKMLRGETHGRILVNIQGNK